jgi:hypothetical protein
MHAIKSPIEGRPSDIVVLFDVSGMKIDFTKDLVPSDRMKSKGVRLATRNGVQVGPVPGP